LAIASRFENASNALLIGAGATESAFKRANLDERAIIHLAVHAVADEKHPQHAALILVGDAASGDDGILEADEILRLRLGADLVVLSACDTAVGRLQGEEGIANLSRAFLLAGAKSVISTLWTLDDTAAPYLMKRFYAHLAERMTIRDALRAAKLDMLNTYGPSAALPYYWAGFKVEGLGSRPVPMGDDRSPKRDTATRSSRSSRQLN
jgi:CHAT domain-containing protein